MVVGGNGEKSEAQMSETIERYDRAMAHKDAGDLEAAVAELEQILVDDPDHVLSHSALAVYLEKLGRSDDAVAHAERVTELDPEDAFAWTQLAVICQRCGRAEQGGQAMAHARQLAGGGPGPGASQPSSGGGSFEV
jgi:Flp pilus assembly protein TadD